LEKVKESSQYFLYCF